MIECYDFVLWLEFGMLARYLFKSMYLLFTSKVYNPSAQKLSKNSQSYMSENSEYTASERQSK